MIIGGIKKIRGNLDPDPEWTLRGDIVAGRPVFVEAVPNLQKRVKVGPSGQELWVKNQTSGELIKPVLELFVPKDNPVVLRAFVQVDLGNGIVQKNYDFEPSRADLDRVAAEKNAMSPATMQRVLEEQQKQIQRLLDFINNRIPSLEVEMNASDDPEGFDVQQVLTSGGLNLEEEVG